MRKDHLVLNGNIRVRTAIEIVRAFTGARAQSNTLHLPVYAHHGTRDKATNLAVRP